MFEIIMRMFDICLFKKGPQDIPASPWLLRFLLCIYIVINFLILFVNSGLALAPLQLLVGIVLLFGFAWVILFVVGKPERYIQTVCALLGTDAVISFFAIPAVATLMSGQGESLAGLIMMGLMLWHLLVTGHIVRHAVSKSWLIGMMVTVLYLLISFQVMSLLFPEVVGLE